MIPERQTDKVFSTHWHSNTEVDLSKISKNPPNLHIASDEAGNTGNEREHLKAVLASSYDKLAILLISGSRL